MSGSIFGKIFKISTWGESHGKALGVVIDGCPAGIELCEDDIQRFLDRRKPGSSQYATKRKEDDTVQILSGIFDGITTGTPISLVIFNTDQKSRDYDNIKDAYRPSHADFGYDSKYGFRDYRGGGRSSARETAARVAGGAVAIKILSDLAISVTAYTTCIGPVAIDKNRFDIAEIYRNPLCMPDHTAYEQAAAYLDECIRRSDSAGGIVECVISGVKPGIGEPVFDKLDAALSSGIFSIGAVKGLEFGLGFQAASSNGSVYNDMFYSDEAGGIKKKSNNAGGITGGMSDGEDIVFRTAFKPTPSIAVPQHTVDNSGKNIELTIHGRHDPVVVPRAVVVVEAMAAVTLVDYILQDLSARIENIKIIYSGGKYAKTKQSGI